MENAILKTIIYADIFDYPLTLFEIHKWLIKKKLNLRQVESTLAKLVKSEKLKLHKGFYFLPRREKLVAIRKRRALQSRKYFQKVKIVAYLLKLNPWIKLVGISGGLAMENAEKTDDIDLFLITAKNRLWLSRILTLVLLSFTGQRRSVNDSKKNAAGKLCPNIFIEEDQLSQASKDLYLAHEVLQMHLLWQRDNIYGKYLEDNEWAFEFLPNWVGPSASLRGAKRRSNLTSKEIAAPSGLAMTTEHFAKWLQLKLMSKPKGLERISDSAVYFHPDDYRMKVLSEYRKKS